jgi:hypothetical protein
MAGLVPAIDVLSGSIKKDVMPGTRPGMTNFNAPSFPRPRRLALFGKCLEALLGVFRHRQ